MALGGKTVGELKRTLTLDELKCWRLYEQEYGPLNLALRIERVVALAGAPHLKGNPVKKLAPWPKDMQPEGSIEDALGILKFAAKQGKQRSKRKRGKS